MENTVEQVALAVKAICQESVPDDGLRFETEGITGERITETAKYVGVRVRSTSYLGSARIPVRIDVGFGDPVVPGSSLVRLSTILDFPPPAVQGYSRESAIAEKYHAMVYRGQLNSRMKDFYDVWSLATHSCFEGSILGEATSKTLVSRGTRLSLNAIVFSEAFAMDSDKQVQWAAFRRRLHVEGTPATLQEVIHVIAAFLLPVTEALVTGQPFHQRWEPGGGWLPAKARTCVAPFKFCLVPTKMVQSRLLNRQTRCSPGELDCLRRGFREFLLGGTSVICTREETCEKYQGFFSGPRV